MAAVFEDENGDPAILMMKQRSDEEYDPEKIALLTADAPPQPPGRKLDDIPLSMRNKLPMNFPDNRHLPPFGLGKPEVHKGTQLEVAARFKEKGNGFFRARRWWDAREAYTGAIEVAPDDDKLMEALWLNLAAANLELKSWPGVLAGAAEAITLNLRSSKGYFRAAHGLIHYQRYDEAVDCCKRVLGYDPTNEAITALLEDPRLGGNVNKASKIGAARKVLEEAYRKHNFIILLTKSAKHHADNFPYLVPAIPKGPSVAKLYCNVAFKYPERHAMDLFLAISPGANIGKTLLGSLPGRPGKPVAWPQDIFFDPNDKTARHVEIVKRQAERRILQENKPPPPWDPGFQYTLQGISTYLETYKRKVLMIEPQATLGEIFELAAQSTPGESDGVCLEEGTVFFNVFRTGSKPEKLWLRGKGRKGFALAYPGYKPVNKKAMLASGQVRTWMIYNPRDVLEEYSLAARAEMLKGSGVMYDRM